MANERLKNAMLEAVSNQLELNEPECTRVTFERLVNSGYDEKTAKEMIAAILIEEMYHIMKKEEEFNESRYAARLEDLGVKTFLDNEESEGDDSDIASMTIEDLIKRIEYNKGFFPREELREIINRKDEAVPFLLKILEQVRDNPQKYMEGAYFGHIYAVYILAQFRVKELYPIFVDLLRLPDGKVHNLFGDSICEAGSRILASVCENDIKPIKDLIADAGVDDYVRGQAVEALVILVLKDILERNEVLAYFRELLNGDIEDVNEMVRAFIICSCQDLYPGELYEDIKAAYEEDRVDDSIVDIEDIERTLGLGKDVVLDCSRIDVHLQYIEDTISEMERWFCFRKDDKADPYHLPESVASKSQTVVKSPKVGRNDTCPCGSGKKYKKCCGKN